MNYFWYALGVALLAWAGYDIYAGYTIAWDIIKKADDPTSYWIVVAVYAAVGAMCLFVPKGKEYE